MARICDICGKRPTVGNQVSHSHRSTRRRWLPNLQKAEIVINGTKRTVKTCTRCLRSFKKQATASL